MKGGFDEAFYGFDLVTKFIEIDFTIIVQIPTFIFVLFFIQFHFVCIEIVSESKLLDGFIIQHLLQACFYCGKRANQFVGGRCQNLSDNHCRQHALALWNGIHVIPAQKF